MDMLTMMAEAYESENDKRLMRGDEADIAAKRAMAAALRRAADAVHGDDEMSDQHAIIIRDWLSYQAEQAP